MVEREGRPLHERVGLNLRAIREQRGLTQEMLAARLTTSWKHTSDATVSAWENGRTPLPLVAIEPLAGALRMRTGELGRSLGLCGDPVPREIAIAEGADILEALADEPPEIATAVLTMFRQSLEIARASRLAQRN